MKKIKKFSDFVNEGLHSVTKEDINSLIKRVKKNKGIDVKWLGKQDEFFVFTIDGVEYTSLSKREAYDKIKSKYNETGSVSESLPEYRDWADLNNPIDANRKKLKVGDEVKMETGSFYMAYENPLRIDNRWKIVSFNQGSSAGVEALIQNKKSRTQRSEAVRYLEKI